MPTTMHAALILISFVVPGESGERIAFGMSVFLSFMVLLLQLNGDLPEVSTSVPALGRYDLSQQLIKHFTIVRLKIVFINPYFIVM